MLILSIQLSFLIRCKQQAMTHVNLDYLGMTGTGGGDLWVIAILVVFRGQASQLRSTEGRERYLSRTRGAGMFEEGVGVCWRLLIIFHLF